MKLRIAIALLSLIVGSATAQSVTDNLVTNPNFNNMTGWTVTGSGSNTSHPVVGPNQYSFGTQGSVARSIAINAALTGTGINVTGIQYGWRFAIYCNNPVGGNANTCANGTGAADTLTANVNVTNTGGTTVFDRTHVYNTSKWSWVAEAQDVNFASTPLASMGHINMTFTGTDGGASAGEPYLGTALSTVYARLKYSVEAADPCVANPLSSTSCAGYQQAYTTQQCSANPLYATDCPGYAAAYHDQQCSINALYASDCTGYAAAYKTQQCTANPLYATDCPAYAEAYLNQQCLLDSLFSNKCEGYKTAYAIKYLVNLDPAVTTAVNSALTTTVEVQRNDPANTVSATGNATVDSVLATPSTTSATSPVSVINSAPAAGTMNSASAPPPPPPPGAAAEQKADAKKTEGAVASVEKKAGGNATAARAAATEKAKELAKDIGRAATLEAQTATQGLLVGLIGYVPGFSAYQNSTVPDALGATVAKQYYKATVDNRSAQRQLSGANETRWKQIVDSQYNKE
jgi:hypothetical protein